MSHSKSPIDFNVSTLMNNTWRILTLDKEDSLELTSKQSQATQFLINFQLTYSPDPKPIRDLWPRTQGRQTKLCTSRCPLPGLLLQSELRLHASPVNHLQPAATAAAAVSRQTAKPISVCDTRPQSFPTNFPNFCVCAKTTTTKTTVWSAAGQKQRCCLTVELPSRLSPPPKPFPTLV